MYKDKPDEGERQEKTRALEKKLVKELWPLLVGMKQQVDRQLVQTFLGLVMAILMHRHRNKWEPCEFSISGALPRDQYL